MSEQEFRIELAGNLIVYIPIKREAKVVQVYVPWFGETLVVQQPYPLAA